MKPRSKVRVLSNAPPQYHGRKGWAMTQHGSYWVVTLEGGGEALLHRSEIEEEAPPAAATDWDEAGLGMLAGFGD